MLCKGDATLCNMVGYIILYNIMRFGKVKLRFGRVLTGALGGLVERLYNVT